MKRKKQFILGLVLVVLFSIQLYSFTIPNLETSSFYDFRFQENFLGVMGTVFSYKIVKLKIGYATNLPNEVSLLGLSCALKNIGEVKYAWQDILKTDIGLWIGYDFNSNFSRYGVFITLLELQF